MPELKQEIRELREMIRSNYKSVVQEQSKFYHDLDKFLEKLEKC